MINSIKQKLEQINLIDTTDHKKAGVMIILLQNDNDSGIKFYLLNGLQVYQLTLVR